MSARLRSVFTSLVRSYFLNRQGPDLRRLVALRLSQLQLIFWMYQTHTRPASHRFMLIYPKRTGRGIIGALCFCADFRRSADCVSGGDPSSGGDTKDVAHVRAKACADASTSWGLPDTATAAAASHAATVIQHLAARSYCSRSELRELMR